jgi:hypothetical protein
LYSRFKQFSFLCSEGMLKFKEKSGCAWATEKKEFCKLLFFFFYHLYHLGEGLPQLAYFRLKHRADNIAGVRITRGLPVPPQNPAHSSHLPPAEGLCVNLSDIHPLCALGRRQTYAMTSRCTSRSAPPRFRWITFEMHIRSQAASSLLPLFDKSSSLLAFEHTPHRSRTLSGEFALSYQFGH